VKEPIIFSTQASLYFAKLIAAQLNLTLGTIESKVFGNVSGGEVYYRIGLDDRMALLNREVILVGSTHSDADCEQLYRVGCAAVMYGARKVIFVIPFMGYSTMERAVKPLEIVSAKTIARKFSSIPLAPGGNYFLFMDLHVEGLVHYFEGSCVRLHLYAEPALLQAFEAHKPETNFVVGTPDLGRPTWAKSYARKFGTRLVLIDKDREGEHTEVAEVIGNVSGCHVVVQDDMSRTFGSIAKAVKAYIEHGAVGVSAIVSHAAFNSADVISLANESQVQKIIVTNTHPMSQHPFVLGSDKFVVANVSGIFSDTIRQILD
jgi:ribose-phosphate pyrophosphokinase